MHRELPPLPTEQPSFTPPHPRSMTWKNPHSNPVAKKDHIRQKQPRSMTWKNPHSHPVSKKGHVDQSSLEKALTDSRKTSLTEQVSKKLDHVDQSTLEKVLTNSRKSSITE
ncbi:hypothetical protein ACS0TY_005847 [Phlomoides rotata]